MIQYPTRTSVISRLMRMKYPSWQNDAIEQTNQFRTAGHFIKKGDMLPNNEKCKEFWGDVKRVFITVQHDKCAFCEKSLEESLIEWDLEHFRPKSEVTEWKLPCANGRDLTQRNFHLKPRATHWEYQYPTGLPMSEGYYLLTYNLENYVASCKTCNSVYKRTYFPIKNGRVAGGDTIAAHDSEGAYLIYPLGDYGENPEDFLQFEGVQAKAKNGSLRGQLLIDFFDLNRESLQFSRANWLLHTFRPTYDAFQANILSGSETMEYLLSHKAPYTNCTRCFMELCIKDFNAANQQYRIMKRILKKYP